MPIFKAKLSDGRTVTLEGDHKPTEEEVLSAVQGYKPDKAPAPQPLEPDFETKLLRANSQVHMPSAFSSGLGDTVPISENPDWAFTQATTREPGQFLKSIPSDVMSVVGDVTSAGLNVPVRIERKIFGTPKEMVTTEDESGKKSISEREKPLPFQQGKPIVQFQRTALQPEGNQLQRLVEGSATPELMATFPFIAAKPVQALFLAQTAPAAIESAKKLVSKDTPPNQRQEAATDLLINGLISYGLTKGLIKSTPTPTEVQDATKTRPQPADGQREYIGTETQRVSTETGGGNRPVPSEEIRQEPQQGPEVPQEKVVATPLTPAEPSIEQARLAESEQGVKTEPMSKVETTSKLPIPTLGEWEKVASVTAGGKPYFWNRTEQKGYGYKQSVVWDRPKGAWTIKINDQPTGKFFDSDVKAKQFVESETKIVDKRLTKKNKGPVPSEPAPTPSPVLPEGTLEKAGKATTLPAPSISVTPKTGKTQAPLEILGTKENIKVTVPKGSTVIRVTPKDKTKGQRVYFVSDLNTGKVTAAGGEYSKVEAGTIGKDKKFKRVTGEVTVEDKTTKFPPGPGAETAGEQKYAAIQQLTDSLKANPETGVTKKLAWSDNAANAWSQGKTVVDRTIGKMLAVRDSLKDIARGVRSVDDLDRRRGQLDFALQQSVARSKIAGETMKKQVKNQTVRDAVMLWIDAGGDEVKLRDAAAKLPAKTPLRIRKAVEMASRLPPEGRELAESLRQYYGIRGQDAVQSEVMEKLLEDYATHIWKRAEDMPETLRAAISNGRVSTYFQFSRQRTIPTLLDGIMEGKVPELDPADIVPYYNYQLDKSIASREFIHDAEENITASDGRPMFTPSGTRSAVPKGDTPDALLINPRGKGYLKVKNEPETPEQEKTRIEQTGDYRTVDHPAMRKWKWAAKDENGNPIFYQADLMVHPEGYERIARMMDRGRLTPTRWGRVALRASTEVKGFKLGLFSLFHPVHVGSHALFHWTNPFKEIRSEPIDWESPKTQFAIEKGHLKIAPDSTELNVFAEGILQPGLLVQKIPWIGPWSRAQAEWTFGEFIPKLKLATFNNAYARALWMRDNLGFFKGLTEDQIATRTGDSVNNAFGELNYWFLNKFGRDPRFQRTLRGIFLAPDFGEARLRFAEKTFTRYGHEERLAIATMFVTMYGIARAANFLASGDPQWDWKHAFSIKVGDHWWSMRSVVSDADRMLADVGRFMYVRLNPLYSRTVFDILYGRDQFGKRLTTSEKYLTRPLEQFVPIQLGALTRDDQKLWESFVGAMGVSAIRDTPIQDAHRLVSEYKEKSSDPKLRAEWERSQQQTFGQSDYQQLRFELQNQNLNGAQKAYQKLLASGKTPAQINMAMRPNRPLSGSYVMDRRVYESLDKNNRILWDKAKKQNEMLYQRFQDIIKESGGSSW